MTKDEGRVTNDGIARAAQAPRVALSIYLNQNDRIHLFPLMPVATRCENCNRWIFLDSKSDRCY